MGWKTSAILIDRAFKAPPEAFVHRLVGTPCSAVQTLSLEEAFHPAATYVGERENSTIILDPKWPEPILERGASPILRELFASFPGASIAAVQLHSVTNFAGFRVFRSETSVRAFMIAADEGVLLDEGAQLPAEARVLTKFRRRDSQDGRSLYLDDEDVEWTLDQLGEELVFEIFRDFLGWRPDEDDAFFEMSVTEVAHAPAKKGFWRRIFPRPLG